MSIKGGIGIGVITVPSTTDTAIFQPLSGERMLVSSCSVNSTAAVVLSVYESPDTTSGSGTLVQTITLASGDRVDIASVIGQGYESTNIIVNASAAGCTIRGTYTHYTGDSV